MMKCLHVTDKELNFLIKTLEDINKVKDEKTMGEFDYNEMLMKLYTTTDTDNIYSVVVDYDNGASIHRVTVLCRAINEEDAFKIVKSVLEKSSDDFVSLVSVNEFDDSLLYICDETRKMV